MPVPPAWPWCSDRGRSSRVRDRRGRGRAFGESSQYRGAGIQIETGQGCLQESVQVLKACVEDLASNQQELGQAELSHVEASSGELLVLVETGDRVRFEQPDGGR